MSNYKYQIQEKGYDCSFYGIATSMVLRHRLRVKNIKTINVKRPTIRAAIPNNDNYGFFGSCNQNSGIYPV